MVLEGQEHVDPSEGRRERPAPSVTHGETLALQRACALLSGDTAIETREVARALGLSRSYFQRFFKRHLGVTPQQYRRRVLAEASRAALAGSRSVTESIYAAGYSSSSRFYEGVGRELGMTPSAARRGAPGERIGFATAACTLGYVLIAWTERGVCEVSLGDHPDAMVEELHAHFPEATLTSSEAPSWMEAVVDTVDGRSHGELPLDVRGTAFQERVWQALRAIPPGETRTYTELAEAVGARHAVRAVASACARNKLAVLVPCHRVVRKDGSLSGYRWGVERKRQLLAREAASVEKP